MQKNKKEKLLKVIFLFFILFSLSGKTLAVTYATWNSATTDAGVTLSNGDLTATSNLGAWASAFTTISKTTGQWYWEITLDATPYNGPAIGIIESSYSSTDTYFTQSVYGWGFRVDGQKETNDTQAGYVSAYSVGDIVGVALDLDAGTIRYYVNGVPQGVGFTSLSGDFYGAVSVNGLAGLTAFTANFGATAFAFEPPGGFCEGLSDTCVTTGGGTSTPSTIATSSSIDQVQNNIFFTYFLFLASFAIMYNILKNN